MAFKKIVTKGEIAHDEQFHLFPQYFQLYLIVNLSLMEIPHIFHDICQYILVEKG